MARARRPGVLDADGLEDAAGVGASATVGLRRGRAKPQPAFRLARRGPDAPRDLGHGQRRVDALPLAQALAEHGVLDVALSKLRDDPPVVLFLEQALRVSHGESHPRGRFGDREVLALDAANGARAAGIAGRAGPVRALLAPVAHRGWE